MIDYEMTIPLLWAGMCQAKSLKEPMVQQGNKKLNEKWLAENKENMPVYQALEPEVFRETLP